MTSISRELLQEITRRGIVALSGALAGYALSIGSTGLGVFGLLCVGFWAAVEPTAQVLRGLEDELEGLEDDVREEGQ